MRSWLPALLLSALLLTACGEAPPSASGRVAGTYALDKAHYREMVLALVRSRHDDAPLPDEQMASIHQLVAGARITLVLDPDGTWSSTGRLADQRIDDAGTWTLEGDTLRLVYTREMGLPVKGRIVTGRRAEDGALLLQPNPGETRPFRFARAR